MAEVSVIVPARDEEPYLADAVASVLRQGDMVRQVLICTERSDSPSAREADRHDERVRAVRCRGDWTYHKLNAGLRSAKFEWLAFIDADDLWAERRLANALDAFTRNPDLDLCFGRALAISADGVHGTHPMDARLLGTTLLRRRTAVRIGSFQSLRFASPMQWLVSAQDLGLRTTTLTEIQLYRRAHAGNQTREDPAALHDAYLRVIRESLQRRRAYPCHHEPARGDGPPAGPPSGA